MNKRIANLGLGLLTLGSVFFIGCGNDNTDIIVGPGATQIREFLLIPNATPDTVAIRGIDIGTGNTAQLSLVGTGAGSDPVYVDVHPTRPLFYVAQPGNSTIGGYILDANGNTVPTANNNLAGPTGARAINIHPSGNWVYVAGNDEIRAYAIQQDGSLGLVNAVNLDVTADASTGDGGFTGNNGSQLHIPTTTGVQTFNVNLTSGALSANSFRTVAGINRIRDLAIHPTGQLVLGTAQVGANANDDFIVPFVVQADGSLAAQANQATGLFDVGESYMARNNVLYVADLNDANVRAFTVGPLGVLTQVTGSPFATSAAGQWMGLDPTESLVFNGTGASLAVSRRLSDNSLAPGTNQPITENLGGFQHYDFFQFVQQI